MRKLNLFFFVISLLFVVSCTSLVRFQSGNESLDYLKGQKLIGLKFDYSDMAVGKFPDEQDYIEKKVKEGNEREPGAGDEWKQKWFGQRETVFEPKFEELANKYIDQPGMDIRRSNTNTDYTIVVHTDFMEPGFNVGVMRRPAVIRGNIKVYKTDNMDKPISTFVFDKVEGQDAMGYDFAVSQRLGQAYAKLGKEFARYVEEHL